MDRNAKLKLQKKKERRQRFVPPPLRPLLCKIIICKQYVFLWKAAKFFNTLCFSSSSPLRTGESVSKPKPLAISCWAEDLQIPQEAEVEPSFASIYANLWRSFYSFCIPLYIFIYAHCNPGRTRMRFCGVKNKFNGPKKRSGGLFIQILFSIPLKSIL